MSYKLALARRPAARYLLRLDDLCPTMNWRVWAEMEETLEQTGIAPILAVVPDNRDPVLRIDPAEERFWDRVRAWQARGWAVALHGHHHLCPTRHPGILRWYWHSEFAGLSYAEQYDKLSQALAIFAREGVRADAFAAPSHSLDWVTVEALAALGLHVISDGLAAGPFRDRHESVWVPQQFARIWPFPLGMWTFCCHPNWLRPHDLHHWQQHMTRYQARFISLADAVAMATRSFSGADRVVWALRVGVSAAKNAVWAVRPWEGHR